jgi:hypothetical protein
MLVTLDLVRLLISFAGVASRYFGPPPDTGVTRLEWYCGCVSIAERIAGLTVWSDETRCSSHAREPLRTVYPPVGGSNGLFN